MIDLSLLFEIAIKHVVLGKLSRCYNVLLIGLRRCEFLDIALIVRSLLQQMIRITLVMLVENRGNILIEMALVTISCCYRYFSIM